MPSHSSTDAMADDAMADDAMADDAMADDARASFIDTATNTLYALPVHNRMRLAAEFAHTDHLVGRDVALGTIHALRADKARAAADALAMRRDILARYLDARADYEKETAEAQAARRSCRQAYVEGMRNALGDLCGIYGITSASLEIDAAPAAPGMPLRAERHA